MKRVLILIALLTGTSVFAQGSGVSGPDLQGSSVNMDEKILTRTELKDILGTCMSNEVLELARIIFKNANLLVEAKFPDTIRGNPGFSSSFNMQLRFLEQNSDNIMNNASAVIEMYDDNYSGKFSMQFDQYTLVNGVSSNFSIGTTTESAPLLEYQEESLPGLYDEYGNVIEAKVVITKTKWHDRAPLQNDLPIDLKTPLQLYNYNTHAPLVGMKFNQARYIECVDLALGKYAP